MNLATVDNAALSLRTARARHGHAKRQERASGVELLRTVLAFVQPMLAAEVRALLAWSAYGKAHPGDAADRLLRYDSGRGVLLIDDTRSERWQVGHDESYEKDGPQLWARADGSLVEVWQIDHADRFEQTRLELREAPKQIGLREAVRRWRAETIIEAIGRWLETATKDHDVATVASLRAAERMRAALGALHGST